MGDTYFRYGYFLPHDHILNVAATFQKCKNNRVIKISCFLTSVITVYLLKRLATKYLIFLQVICCFLIFVNGGSMKNAKAYQVSAMTKRLKSTDLHLLTTC